MLKNGKKIEKIFSSWKDVFLLNLCLFRIPDFYETKTHKSMSKIYCDFIGCWKGSFIGIELKSTSHPNGFNKYKLAKKQLMFLNELVSVGANVILGIYFEHEDICFLIDFKYFCQIKIPHFLSIQFCFKNFIYIENISIENNIQKFGKKLEELFAKDNSKT